LVSLVAEPMTGLVDTFFVARLGAAPLAALGVGTVLLSSTLWMFNFLGVGTQTEVAHALGAADVGHGQCTASASAVRWAHPAKCGRPPSSISRSVCSADPRYW
jgi:MATE family multidrug resistance protein